MKIWQDIKEWLALRLDAIGEFIGIKDFHVVGWIGLGIIALLLIIVIAIIVCKSLDKKGKNNSEKAAKPQPTAKPAVKETVAVESAVAEEKAEEKPAEKPVEKPVEEPKAEVKAKEVKEEEPKVEEKKESAKKSTTKTKSAVKPEKPKAAKAKKPVAKSEKPQAEKVEKVEKPSTKSTAKPVAKAEKPKALGKWMIERKSDDEYISVLFASNGEAMLTSETYVSEDGARKGVATIVKAVENGDFVIYKNKNGNYYFKLKSAANRLLCAGEIYKDKAGCESAVESVKRIAKDSPVIEEVSDGEKYLAYTPVALNDDDLKNAAKGKWKIEKNDEGKFYAILYASNGQVMLSTEEVASKPTALAGIENVKKNALAGNFVIDKDKFGKFYYKLRNANKSVICIGESYPTSARCISALESVRKFAMTSPLIEE